MTAHAHHHHAHKIDAERLVEQVRNLSKTRGERMTDVRRDVVVALCRLQKPHSAYQILAELNKKRGVKLSAMSLYRTLDFLIRLGVLIKLESRNSYQLCGGGGHDHSHLLMICDSCGATEEVSDKATSKKLHALAQQHGHTLKHHVVELHGTCARCEA